MRTIRSVQGQVITSDVGHLPPKKERKKERKKEMLDSAACYCHLLPSPAWSAATACFAKPKPWGRSDLEATLGTRRDPEHSELMICPV